MKTHVPFGRLACLVGLLAIGLILCGCPAETPAPPPAPPTEPAEEPVAPEPAEPAAPVDEPPVTYPPPLGVEEPETPDSPAMPGPEDEEPFVFPPPAAPEGVEPMPEDMTEEKPELGSPLVDRAEALHALDPVQPLWIDKEGKQVVMIGLVCQTDVPLEMFACLERTKEHESIVAVPVEAFKVHTALLAVGATPGTPVRWAPSYSPASGEKIEVLIRWKDAEGDVQSGRAQDWIRNTKSGRAMEQDWVFAGSGFWDDPDSNERYYMAEGGDFICVANFSSALLDLPIKSTDTDEALMFEAFTDRIPPVGTPVTIILKPTGTIIKPEAPADEPAPEEPAAEAPSAEPIEEPAAEPAPEEPAIEGPILDMTM